MPPAQTAGYKGTTQGLRPRGRRLHHSSALLIGGLAQLARAPALQAGGQRFESVILHLVIPSARAGDEKRSTLTYWKFKRAKGRTLNESRCRQKTQNLTITQEQFTSLVAAVERGRTRKPK